MSIMIQIRNVPDDLHRAAKSRAALEGVSLSDFARRALEREIARPTASELAARIRLLPTVETERTPAAMVREERDAR
ncbi:MAG: YlcI/YnfO family protein [Longimicrobiales bacterium]|nr:YlcI/YnfO family protein [Longimicrobiales bacterium]